MFFTLHQLFFDNSKKISTIEFSGFFSFLFFFFSQLSLCVRRRSRHSSLTVDVGRCYMWLFLLASLFLSSTTPTHKLHLPFLFLLPLSHYNYYHSFLLFLILFYLLMSGGLFYFDTTFYATSTRSGYLLNPAGTL